jgi:hypothetical protein
MEDDMPEHKGACHCGAVTFAFKAPSILTMTQCNCSVCSLSAYEHVFVPEDDFTLLTGAQDLTEYRFGSKAAIHLFCRHCGVKAFYRPRSHPDKYSVNFRAITPGTLTISKVFPFDGKNWARNIQALREQT